MVGLGETPEEVEELMDDLHRAGCQILTIGQYLQPSHKHYPVARIRYSLHWSLLTKKPVWQRIRSGRKCTFGTFFLSCRKTGTVLQKRNEVKTNCSTYLLSMR